MSRPPAMPPPAPVEVSPPFSIGVVVRGFWWLSMAEVIRAVGTAAIAVYLARRLGATSFGYYGFALAVLAYFTAIVDGGLTSVGSRQVSQRPAQLRTTVSTVLAIRGVLAIASFVCLTIVVAMLGKPPLAKTVLLLSGATLFTSAVTLDWLFYGLQRPQLISIATVVRVALFGTLTLAFVRRPEQIWAVPLFQVLADLTAAAWLGWTYGNGIAGARPKADPAASPVRDLAHDAWPLAAGQLLRATSFSFGMTMVAFLLGDNATGQYAAAQRLMQAALGFGSLYFVGYLPALSRATIEGHVAVRRLLGDSLHLTAIFTVPLAVGGTVLARPIVVRLLGSDYAASAAPLAILVWVLPVLTFGGHFRNTLIAARRVRVDLAWVGCSAATNVVLTLLLTPRFELRGAAAAFLAAEMTLALGTYAAVRRRLAA